MSSYYRKTCIFLLQYNSVIVCTSCFLFRLSSEIILPPRINIVCNIVYVFKFAFWHHFLVYIGTIYTLYMHIVCVHTNNNIHICMLLHILHIIIHICDPSTYKVYRIWSLYDTPISSCYSYGLLNIRVSFPGSRSNFGPGCIPGYFDKYGDILDLFFSI